MDDRTIPLKKANLISAHMGEKEKQNLRDVARYGNALFEQTTECVFIINLDLQYLAANQPALDLVGYSQEELQGIPVSAIMSLQETSEHSANTYERTLRCKDGRVIPIEIATMIVSDEKGEPSYIQSIVRDISERKRTEQLLKRQARILSVISEASARLLRSSNIKAGILDTLDMLGYALDTFCCVVFEIDRFQVQPALTIKYQWLEEHAKRFDIPSAIRPHIHSLLAEQNKALVQVKAGVDATISEYSFIAIPLEGVHDGHVYLGLFDHKNNLSWLVSDFDAIQTSANVISAALQRMHYENALLDNQARNRIIVDALPDLVIRINNQSEILDYSCSPDHPLHIHRDMIQGRKFTETWPEEVVAKIIGEDNKGTFSQEHWVEKFKLPFSSNTYESRLHPINGQEALIIIRDIGALIRLNDMKTDFINRASHELRTPLTTAILMADLIEQGGPKEEVEECWSTLRRELERQKNLIDRLLMAGRLESGMLIMEKAPLNLHAILEESAQAVKAIAGKKQVRLDLMPFESTLKILGDKGALEQVFINLFNNAIKFSPENSCIHVWTELKDRMVEIHIKDQGMGISPEAIPYLFEKFFRAKNVTIAEIPGSGVGLYIVKSIVEELGGTITVGSELNEGTTFTVTLMLAEPHVLEHIT